MKTLCFVSLHAYPVVDPEATGIYGGTETRAVTLATGCVRHPGYAIQFLARNPRLTARCKIDGLEWIPWRDFWTELRARVSRDIEFRPNSRWPRLKRWRSALLWQLPLLAATRPIRIQRDHARLGHKVFSRTGANCYFVFGVNSASTTAIHNARLLGKPSVLFLGANSDLDERYTPHSTYITPYGERATNCYWALRHADRIVVQNTYQLETLKQRFGRDGLLLPNPIDLTAWEQLASHNLDRHRIPWSDYILWVGRAETFHKRADLAVQLARELPERNFVLVLNPRDAAVEQAIRQDLAANVHLIERAAFEEMPALFRGARVFLNTSAQAYEGFPNTFLQSLAGRVPIASLEVAGDFLATTRGGLCAEGNPRVLKEIVQTLAGRPLPATVNLSHAHSYIRQHHDLAAAAQTLLRLAEDLLV